MATRYKIQVGNEVIEFEGPDNMTEDQIIALGNETLRTAKPGEEFPSAVYQPDPNESSAVGAATRGGVQGLTSNWGDELAALGNAAGLAGLDNLTGAASNQQAFWDNPEGFWAAYENNMDQSQRQAEADTVLHPRAKMGGTVAGAVAQGVLGAKALEATKLVPQAVSGYAVANPIKTAAAVGTGQGAVGGAGEGRGNRGQSAALGGVTGAAVGSAIGGAFQLAPKLTNYVRTILNKSPLPEAMRQIAQALRRDGYDVSSPAGAQALRDELQRFTGKPVSLADVGAATRARTGVGLRSPNAAQQQSIDTLENRATGARARLVNDVRANVSPRTDVHTMDEELIAQRAEVAKGLREKALFEEGAVPQPAMRPQLEPVPSSDPMAGVRRTLGEETPADTYALVPQPEALPATGRVSRMVDDPTLNQLARLPMAQKALTSAQAIANSERDLLASQGLPIDHLPDYTPGGDLDMRAFDYLKRFLDDETNRLYKRGDTSTFSAAEANQVKELRNAIRERLRVVNPDYGDYLDAYSGSSEMIEALKEGADFLKRSPEQISSSQIKRSEAGQELYRAGAARSLIDDILSTKDTGNAARRILNSDEDRAALAATGVDPASLARLNNSVAQERQLNLLNNELTGSQTAQRGAAQADADAGAHMQVPFNPGSPIGWLGMLGRSVINRAAPARNAAINEQLLPRMMATDPAAIEGVIAQLEASGQKAAAEELRRSLRGIRTSATVGNIIGAPVALPQQ